MARQGEAGKAEALFRRVLEIQPQNEQAANNLGVLYARTGRAQLALETFRTFLERSPESGSVFTNLVRRNLSLGKAGEASALLELWLSRHPAGVVALQLMEQVKQKRQVAVCG